MKPQASYSQRPSCACKTSVSKEGEVDVLIEEAGSICLFHLLTARADAWVSLRPDRGWYTLVGALVVDESYTDAFAQWMRAEGLCVAVMAPCGTA